MEAKRVYHVHLHEAFEGEKDYYFGSIIAIFRTIPERLIGVTYKTLKSRKLRDYQNQNCIIKVRDIKRNERK